MDERGKFTFAEITSQPAAWDDAYLAFVASQSDLKQAWEAAGARRVLFVGCGSTYFLSQSAAALFEAQTGVPAKALPASELVLFPDRVLHHAAETILVTISRSGTTTETIRAQESYRRHGGRINWTITCYPESLLAAGADLVLPAIAAQEQSVAQTRSFASMLLISQLLAATLGGQDVSEAQKLPGLGQRLLHKTQPLMAELGSRLDMDRLYFLGSGFQYGVANEAMLKMTEMSLSFSGGYHFMEFRHGPMSMVTDTALLCGLISGNGSAQERLVLAEMQELGAATLGIGPDSSAKGADWQIDLESRVPEWARPVLYLPPLQLLAYYRALAKGLDPDNPRNLTAVVHLDAS